MSRIERRPFNVAAACVMPRTRYDGLLSARVMPMLPALVPGLVTLGICAYQLTNALWGVHGAADARHRVADDAARGVR